MKKKLLLFAFAFASGFLTHALVFPDFLANGFTDVSKIVIPQPSPEQKQTDPLITQITFDGKKFSRHTIRVSFSRYLEIINTNPKQQMWLISNLPELTTERGYGESEAIKAQFNEKGTFVVQDKNNPSERLVITVK
ncbi:MAG TPA: hypothetical protein VLF20_03925 [Patescibacteria group bacterium]|nr:hypothetical protein [Patescibacteria group bacterium]